MYDKTEGVGGNPGGSNTKKTIISLLCVFPEHVKKSGDNIRYVGDCELR